MTDPIAPLVPAELDLRDFGFMPIDIVRLFGSEFHAQSDDAAWRAGVTLWLKSYHQVPAASLPDDDVALARLAELGRDLRSWKKIKQAALRGWIKCSDGRLYHPVVAEKALEGWIEKMTQRKSSAAGNAKRYEQEFDPTSFDDAIKASLARLATLNPQSRILAKRFGKRTAGSPAGSDNRHKDAPIGSFELPGGSENRPYGSALGSPDCLPSGSQGTGTGTDKEFFSLRSKDARASASPDRPVGKPKRTATQRHHPFPEDAFELWYGGYPHKVGRGAAEKAFEKAFKSDEVAFETLVAARDRYVRGKPSVQAWCNPATWLNERRWLDEPAILFVADPSISSASPEDPRIDLGGGTVAPYSTIRNVWSKGRWPGDWGPPPGEPGCLIPAETMSIIMGEKAA